MTNPVARTALICGISGQDGALLASLLLKSADLVTAVSRYTRRRFLSWAQIEHHRVRVLPNTYHPPVSSPVSKAALKARYGLAGRRVLLTVSRLDRGDSYKGHQRVFAAIRELTRTHPELLYLVVGEGDNRQTLEDMARAQGIADRVQFTGRVDAERLNDLYYLADVFVMPSSKEGLGIVFLEAGARNLAVIAGNSDGSADACADGAIGECIADDPVALIEAIKAALAAPPRDISMPVQRFRFAKFRGFLGALLASLAPAR